MVLNNIERDKFIEDNLNLVYSIVHKNFRNAQHYTSIDFDDLVSVGSIGLIKAVDYFNESYGLQFSTYAVPTIYGYIAKYLRDNSCMVKFPREIKDLYWQVFKNNMQESTVDQIVEKLGITKNKATDVLKYADAKILNSLDFQIDESGKDSYSTTAIYDQDFESGLLIHEIKKQLSFKEKQIFDLKMEGKTQNQIAKAVGRSQVYVSRMLIQIKEKVRKYLVDGD